MTIPWVPQENTNPPLQLSKEEARGRERGICPQGYILIQLSQAVLSGERVVVEKHVQEETQTPISRADEERSLYCFQQRQLEAF